MKPDFRTLRYGFHTHSDVNEWVDREAAYFKEQGATHFRLAVDPNDCERRVIEGWIQRPEKEPEPNFTEVAR